MAGEPINQLLVNGNGFAFLPGSGESFTLNGTGIDLVRWLQQGLTGDDLTQQFSEKYGLTITAAARDIQDFLLDLDSLGLACHACSSEQ